MIVWCLIIRFPLCRRVILLHGLLSASPRPANCNLCCHKQLPHHLNFHLPRMMSSNTIFFCCQLSSSTHPNPRHHHLLVYPLQRLFRRGLTLRRLTGVVETYDDSKSPKSLARVDRPPRRRMSLAIFMNRRRSS